MAGTLMPHHLLHSAAGAWFDPITLMAMVPSRATDTQSDEEKLALLHENIHYFQSVTTLYGAGRFHSFWWVLSDLHKGMKSLASGENFDRERFRLQREDKLGALDYLTLDASYAMGVEILRVETPLRGFQMLDIGERTIPAYCRPDKRSGLTTIHPLGALSLQESMALSIERHFGHSDDTYRYARDHDGAEFRYAAAAEMLADYCGWTDDLWWLVTLACDVALDQYLPSHAYVRCLIHLKENYECAPRLSDAERLYAELREAIRTEAEEEQREAFDRELKSVLERGATGTTEFDEVMLALFQALEAGIALRRTEPDAVVGFLLAPSALSAATMERFVLPCYETSTGFSATTTNDKLVWAILAMQAFQHIVQCVAAEPVARTCPFYSAAQTCKFPRDENCRVRPWARELIDGGACLYRFAADGVGIAPEAQL